MASDYRLEVCRDSVETGSDLLTQLHWRQPLCQAPTVSFSIRMFLLLQTTRFSACINTVTAIKDLGAFIPVYTVAGECRHFLHCANATVCYVRIFQRQGQNKIIKGIC